MFFNRKMAFLAKIITHFFLKKLLATKDINPEREIRIMHLKTVRRIKFLILNAINFH